MIPLTTLPFPSSSLSLQQLLTYTCIRDGLLAVILLGKSPPRNPHDSLPHHLQAFAEVFSSWWRFPWQCYLKLYPIIPGILLPFPWSIYNLFHTWLICLFMSFSAPTRIWAQKRQGTPPPCPFSQPFVSFIALTKYTTTLLICCFPVSRLCPLHVHTNL